MTADLLLTLDAGGSYVKATIFDPATGWHNTTTEAVPLYRPFAGANERDAEELWTTAIRCLRGALDGVAHGPQRVAAVGITGHGNGVYLVDARGLPTRRAIMAADSRAADEVRQWVSEGLTEELRPHAWNGLWAGQPGPILSHLSRHEPETLRRSHALLSCKDFLRARLTGELATELSDAVAGALYDNEALARGETTVPSGHRQLRAFGLDAHEHLLLQPVPSDAGFEVSSQAAMETGLRAGTAVVAGLVDNSAMQHGSGVFDSSMVCVGAGTWSINQLLVPVSHVTDYVLRVQPFAASFGLGGTALLSEASATSASTLEWALDRAVTGSADRDRSLGRNAFEGRFEREAARPIQKDDPIFLPYLDGSREDAGARGAWLGLSSATGEDELIGAIVEGVCSEHRRHVERLERGVDRRLPVRLSGGATKSAVWCQRFADILARPVQSSALNELGSVGVAALAGASVGLFDSVESGVFILNPTWQTYEPDHTRAELVEDRYDRYCKWASLLESKAWA